MPNGQENTQWLIWKDNWQQSREAELPPTQYLDISKDGDTEFSKCWSRVKSAQNDVTTDVVFNLKQRKIYNILNH